MHWELLSADATVTAKVYSKQWDCLAATLYEKQDSLLSLQQC